MTARKKYRLVLFGSLVLGLLLKLPSVWSAVGIEWKQLASEVGTALIIAFVLAMLVDWAVKKELLTEFARDVSGHIIGQLLPVELREHLRGYLEMSLVRENWNIRYNLKPLPPHYVEVGVVSDYVMVNRSSDEQTFPFVIKVEKGWYRAVGKENLITMVSANEERRDQPRCDDEDGHWVHKWPVKLPPYDRDNPQRTRFHAQAVQYFFECAFSPFISMWPVSNTAVTVTYPKDDYDVLLDTTFRPRKALVRNDLQDGTQWEINEPILPGQGFFVRWSKKSIPMAATIPIREPAA